MTQDTRKEEKNGHLVEFRDLDTEINVRDSIVCHRCGKVTGNVLWYEDNPCKELAEDQQTLGQF